MAFEVPRCPTRTTRSSRTSTRQTMRIHHDKHHQAYVDKANAALEGTEWADESVEEVLKNLDSLPRTSRGAVRNNGGGHYNHSLFWESMKPGGGGEPSGALADAINAKFGSFSDFQAKFKEPASTGSAPAGRGWSPTARAASTSSPRPTRTTRSPTARRRCWASTSGSTRTT